MNADQRWTLAVLEADNWTCRVGDCGANTCLDAAHIRPKSLRPDLRHDPANGLTLCRSHHRYFHDHPTQWKMFLAAEGYVL